MIAGGRLDGAWVGPDSPRSEQRRATREDGGGDASGALVEPAHRVQDPAHHRQGDKHTQGQRQQHRPGDQRPRLELALAQRAGG